MYAYKSRVGTFRIYRGYGKWCLALGESFCELHDSPVAAADSVFTHTTGYAPWDNLDGIVEGPSDLSEWRFL